MSVRMSSVVMDIPGTVLVSEPYCRSELWSFLLPRYFHGRSPLRMA